MAFNWSDYLDLARELAQRQTDEAALRSAVSRAYYAVYCSARDVLASEGNYAPKGQPVHKWVWDEFKSHPDPGRQFIGSTADSLRRDRALADYDRAPTRWSARAHAAVLTAASVMSSLGQLGQPQP